MNPPVIVIGAGGHAAVVADALLAAGERVLGYTDADPTRRGPGPCTLMVLGDDEILADHDPMAVRLANGIGGVGRPEQIALRRTVQQGLEARGWRFTEVRHPSAVVSAFAQIGDAAQLLAGSIVQAGARIGTGCIVNTGAIIEHDVSLGEWTHVAPRALLCGNVIVGAGCHVGAGAVVRQGLMLAACTLVGAGAVVVRASARGDTLVGVPARPAKIKP